MKSQTFLKSLNKPNWRWPLMVRCVHGHSMVPVLPPGTKVWGWRWFRDIQAEDVVIFLHGGKEKIKRVTEIKDNELFVLGDHKDASTDSRQFGRISESDVLARVVWPKDILRTRH